MPSLDALDPLGPDACRSDPSAPCAYWHLKLHALNGGRDKLSERELKCVGVGVSVRTDTSNGWHQPDALFVDDFLAGFELSAEDSEVLHGLMAISTVDVNRDRLEFLG